MSPPVRRKFLVFLGLFLFGWGTARGDFMFETVKVPSNPPTSSTTTTTTTTQSSAPPDCEWTEWCACSASCGGGFRLRQRKITAACPLCGKHLNATQSLIDSEFLTCNTNPCPQDCQVSEWGCWSGCSEPCGGGKQERRKAVIQGTLYGGAACPPINEKRPCNEQPCPFDCVAEKWSEWGECSKTCAGGSQERTRSVPLVGPVKREGTNQTCPEKQEERPCNVLPCPVDCDLTEWTEWSACPNCGDNAVQVSYRQHRQFAQYGGAACNGTLIRTQDCSLTVPCDVARLEFDCEDVEKSKFIVADVCPKWYVYCPGYNKTGYASMCEEGKVFSERYGYCVDNDTCSALDFPFGLHYPLPKSFYHGQGHLFPHGFRSGKFGFGDFGKFGFGHFGKFGFGGTPFGQFAGKFGQFGHGFPKAPFSPFSHFGGGYGYGYPPADEEEEEEDDSKDPKFPFFPGGGYPFHGGPHAPSFPSFPSNPHGGFGSWPPASPTAKPAPPSAPPVPEGFCKGRGDGAYELCACCSEFIYCVEYTSIRKICPDPDTTLFDPVNKRCAAASTIPGCAPPSSPPFNPYLPAAPSNPHQKPNFNPYSG